MKRRLGESEGLTVDARRVMVDFINAGFNRARVQTEGKAQVTMAEPVSKPKVPTWMYVVFGASLATLFVSWSMLPETPAAKLAREQQAQKEWELVVLSCEAQSQTQMQASACVVLASRGLRERL